MEELQSKGEDKCARIEAEYATLRSGIKSMNERWRTEMISLRSDLTKMEEVHRKELDEGRARCSKCVCFSHRFIHAYPLIVLLLRSDGAIHDP